MSTFAVEAVPLEVMSHPNADALELAQVGLFRAVVRKGDFATGDVALYIPEGSIVPDPLLEEMGLTGRLAGKGKNRVKAIRLRGELSQGLVYRPAFPVLPGLDYAEALGVTKYVPEVPASMAGTMVPAPNFVPMFEVENIKKYPDMLVPGEMVTATEKVHGSNVSVVLDEDALLVSSKGVGQRLMALAPAEGNLYWRAVWVNGVEEKIRLLRDYLGVRGARFALFAEVYGKGVQDLTYGHASVNEPGFMVFDAWVEERGFVPQDILRAACNAFGLEMAPLVYEGPYDYDTLAACADGQTIVGNGAHIREGVVVRPVTERVYAGTWGRAIAKFVSEAYLMRSGDATEFE